MPRITSLLVANRGEIASRVMRSAAAMGIGTVAVFSDADADAPYVREADVAVRLPGVTPAETYLRADAVIQAALSAGADAVHPGYGFLSENASFAAACAEAGLVFVGPPASAIEAMGSKLAAKELMSAAGVPVLPSATVAGASAAELEEAAGRIGFPILVKAAFGGGGRGMRIVRDVAGLAEAVAGAEREAASAFGDGTVFLERYVESPRHVEVQIFGDAHGNVVHLFERDCSVQRRHQKVIEESPSPAVTPELRAELGAAAVAAGKAIGYRNAGTVEFVLDPDGSFFFLEVNTRLQVEHPVTELVTGLDLVRLQLTVAAGEPLPEEVLTATMTGHAIEARLYAEDVPAGFLPVSGPLHRFRVPAAPGVRVDAGFEDGSVVSVHYDPMLAKVIAHAPTRAEASALLARTLARAEIHGVVTNRDLLVGVLREEDFLAGRATTAYLEEHDPAALSASAAGDPALHAVAAALVTQHRRRAGARVLATLPSGWRNAPSAPQATAFKVDGRELEVTYTITGERVDATVDGRALPRLRATRTGPDGVDLECEGKRRRYRVHRVGMALYVDSSDGSLALTEVERFPDPGDQVHVGSLLAPMPGNVVRVEVAVGDVVEAGQPVVVLEAMKMEHTVRAPARGTVTALHAQPGDQVDAQQALAVLDEEEDA